MIQRAFAVSSFPPLFFAYQLQFWLSFLPEKFNNLSINYYIIITLPLKVSQVLEENLFFVEHPLLLWLGPPIIGKNNFVIWALRIWAGPSPVSHLCFTFEWLSQKRSNLYCLCFKRSHLPLNHNL